MASALKILGLMLILVSASALLLGTGAFTAINADRGGHIGIASDDAALLGVGIDDREVTDNQEFTLVTVENRFDDELDAVDATVVDDGGFNEVSIVETPEPLAAGESGDIRAQVVFGSQSSGTIEVEIAASGPGGSVELSREVFVQRSAPPVCSIDDDRIGERAFVAEDEFFDCTVEIEAQNYEVDLETTTITQDLLVDVSNLHEFEFETSEVGGSTSIGADNVNGDVELEDSTFGDNFRLEVARNLNGDVELEGSTFERGLAIDVDGSPNGDIEIESTDVGEDLDITFGQNPSGDVGIEGTSVDGDVTVVVEGNLNSDLEIEESTIGGDLTVIVHGHANGDIEIEDNEIGGDLLVSIDHLNGDVGVEGNDVIGNLTVEIDQKTEAADVELEDNDVGGETTEDY